MEPWGPTAVTFFRCENCSFRIPLCFREGKECCIIVINFLETPFFRRLKYFPLCYTLLDSFELSKETLGTSKFQSKEMFSV